MLYLGICLFFSTNVFPSIYIYDAHTITKTKIAKNVQEMHFDSLMNHTHLILNVIVLSNCRTEKEKNVGVRAMDARARLCEEVPMITFGKQRVER